MENEMRNIPSLMEYIDNPQRRVVSQVNDLADARPEFNQIVTGTGDREYWTVEDHAAGAIHYTVSDDETCLNFGSGVNTFSLPYNTQESLVRVIDIADRVEAFDTDVLKRIYKASAKELNKRNLK